MDTPNCRCRPSSDDEAINNSTSLPAKLLKRPESLADLVMPSKVRLHDISDSANHGAPLALDAQPDAIPVLTHACDDRCVSDVERIFSSGQDSSVGIRKKPGRRWSSAYRRPLEILLSLSNNSQQPPAPIAAFSPAGVARSPMPRQGKRLSFWSKVPLAKGLQAAYRISMSPKQRLKTDLRPWHGTSTLSTPKGSLRGSLRTAPSNQSSPGRIKKSSVKPMPMVRKTAMAQSRVLQMPLMSRKCVHLQGMARLFHTAKYA